MTDYTQRQKLQFTAPELFDLVADVERYPEFLPWVSEVRIHHRNAHAILVDMTIATGPLRKRFSTAAALDRPRCIDISSQDPMFVRFEQRWTFEPAIENGTDVEYHVSFEFRSRLLQRLVGESLVDWAVATMAAFKRRANWLYGGQP